MAIYCVSPSGSNTAPYDTKAKAATALSTILALALTGANTVNIFPGVYNIAALLNLSNAKYNNLTIKGVDSTGIFSVDRTLVKLGEASPSTLFYVDGAANPTGVRVENLTLAPNGASRAAVALTTTTTDWVFKNVLIEPQAGTGCGQPINCNNAANITFDGVTVRSGEIASGVAVVRLRGATSATIKDCVVEALNGDNNYSTGGIIVENTSTATITGTHISGLSAAAISSASSGNVVVSDCPCLIGAGLAVVAKSGVGAVTVSKSNIIAAGYAPVAHYLGAGVTDGGGNVLGRNPRLHKYARQGYVVPCVDDGNITQLQYVQALAPMLAARGMTGTWYTYGAPGTSFDATVEGPSRQALRDIVLGGAVEIAAHTWSHTDVRAATGTYGSMSRTGGTTKTYKIDLVNHVFSVDVDGTTINVSLSADNSDMMSSVMAQINTTDSAWIFTPAAILTSTRVKISSLKATAGFVNISTPLYFNKDSASSSFYQDEIINFKSVLPSWINALGDITDPQTGQTYAANSFSEPGGAQDATSIAAVKAAGYLGSRPAGGAFSTLANMNIYTRGFLMVDTGVLGATEADTIANVNSICANAAQSGFIVFLLSHSPSECPLTDANSWETILDALKPWQDVGAIKVQSAQKTYLEVRSAPWTLTDGVVTRTYDTYAEYNEPGFSLWQTFGSTMPHLALSHDAPGKLKAVQEWSRANVTKQDIEKAAK